MKLNLVPARTGVLWVRSGLKVFAKQPLAFISLFFLFFAGISTVSQIPVIGGLLAPALLPFMTLGLMVATSVADANEGKRRASPAMFVAAAGAIRAHWRPLAVLGLISTLYCIAMVGLSTLLDGGTFARVYLLDETLTPEMLARSDFQLARMFVLALNLPLSLTMWHAPALVHWYQVEPVKSLFFSWMALFRNFRAYALFCVTWLGLFIAASLILSLITVLLVGIGMLSFGDGASVIGTALIFGGALVLAAMSLSSTWFTFRDSFHGD